jgi:microcystin-dependent protein
MSEPFLGEIRVFGFNFAPKGWAKCNGQLLPINQNQALFALLGTQYGGNGITTFALPNLQGRAPVGVGTGSGGAPTVTQGETGGAQHVALTVNQLPAHNHLVNCHGANGNRNSPTGNFPARDLVHLFDTYADTSDNHTMNAQTIANTGGNQPVPTLSPFLGLNFCIALFGIFPTQS